MELPGIEKPNTFGGRAKNTPNNEYVKTLERKVNFLQSQLANFEKRHKALEEVARKTQVGMGGSGFRNAEVRKNKKKRLAADEDGIKDRAARVIQRHWRAHKLKKIENARRLRVKKPIEKSKTPLTEKKPVLKDLRVSAPKKESPIASLQSSKFPSSMRNYSLHPIVESKLESKSKNATVIQSNFRRFLQQKNYNQIKGATVKIQSFARKFICRRLFVSILQAILFIQRSWRRYKLRKLKVE